MYYNHKPSFNSEAGFDPYLNEVLYYFNSPINSEVITHELTHAFEKYIPDDYKRRIFREGDIRYANLRRRNNPVLEQHIYQLEMMIQKGDMDGLYDAFSEDCDGYLANNTGINLSEFEIHYMYKVITEKHGVKLMYYQETEDVFPLEKEILAYYLMERPEILSQILNEFRNN